MVKSVLHKSLSFESYLRLKFLGGIKKEVKRTKIPLTEFNKKK